MNFLTSIALETADAFDGVLGMIDASFSVAEFDLAGNVIRVNDNFLSLSGYDESEVLGRHHSMFLSDDVAESPEYGLCWADLRAGKSKSVILPWTTKTGERKWVEETVGPVKDRNGKVIRIVRLGVDVTARHDSLADLQGKVQAVEHHQAVVEFDIVGNILTANHNFLVAMGYSLSEVAGKHHSMFVDPDDAGRSDYRAFWWSLARGKATVRQSKCLGKNRREVWFEASYNPIYGADGTVCKIVKIASDITDQVTSLADLKSTLEAGFDDVDQTIGKLDQNFEDVTASWRQAHAHLEVSAMIAGRLVSSVDETALRMTELRSVADDAFDHAIESDTAIAAFEKAVDVLRDCARDDPAIIEQVNVLEKCVGETARVSTAVRADIKAVLSRVAVVSLAVAQQGDITHQVNSEMHGIQTALDASQKPFKNMTRASEDISMIIGQAREATGILAR